MKGKDFPNGIGVLLGRDGNWYAAWFIADTFTLDYGLPETSPERALAKAKSHLWAVNPDSCNRTRRGWALSGHNPKHRENTDVGEESVERLTRELAIACEALRDTETKLEAARAEADRMRPVYEAAMAHATHPIDITVNNVNPVKPSAQEPAP